MRIMGDFFVMGEVTLAAIRCWLAGMTVLRRFRVARSAGKTTVRRPVMAVGVNNGNKDRGIRGIFPGMAGKTKSGFAFYLFGLSGCKTPVAGQTRRVFFSRLRQMFPGIMTDPALSAKGNRRVQLRLCGGMARIMWIMAGDAVFNIFGLADIHSTMDTGFKVIRNGFMASRTGIRCKKIPGFFIYIAGLRMRLIRRDCPVTFRTAGPAVNRNMELVGIDQPGGLRRSPTQQHQT